MINKSKRVGRGIGSGKGKTAGRGTKGQKARGKMPLTFTGSNLPLYKKLPLKRGLGNRSVSVKPKLLSVSSLVTFPPGATVDLESLMQQGLISAKDAKKGVKILSSGEVGNRLIVKVPASEKARLEIEKKGGKVDV